MKLKETMILSAACAAVLAAAAGPAQATTASAFGAFHSQSATVLTKDPYLCITEDNGAVVNNCTTSVNFYFNLPITTTGKKTVHVQDYWNAPTSFTPFNCVSYVYAGISSTSTEGTTLTFTASATTLSTTDDVPATGDHSLSVICWEVPPGEGVASVKWNE